MNSDSVVFVSQHPVIGQNKPKSDPLNSIIIKPDIIENLVKSVRINSATNGRATTTEETGTTSLEALINGGGKRFWEKLPLFRYRGFIFTLISSLCFSLTALIVKYLEKYNPVNLALWRYQGAFLPAIPFVVFHLLTSREQGNEVKNPVTGSGKRKAVVLLLIRSILTCNALLLHFYSLSYLKLGDALVISSSTPVFAYFFAHYFLGEPCGIVPIVTSLTTLLGVVVILRPPHLTGQEEFDCATIMGTCLALGSTLLATLSFVVLRYLRRMHYSFTMVAFGSWGTLENAAVALIFGVFALPQTSEDWLLAGGLASLTFFGQLAIIWALKCEETGPVSLVRTFDVIFGFMWQVLISKVLPDTFSMIGAAIVIVGVAITGIRKWVATLPANCATREKLWFLLK